MNLFEIFSKELLEDCSKELLEKFPKKTSEGISEETNFHGNPGEIPVELLNDLLEEFVVST